MRCLEINCGLGRTSEIGSAEIGSASTNRNDARVRQNVPGTSAADPRWKFAAEGERGALAFDDKQLYAKALAYFEPLLDGARGGLARRVLRKLDEEVNSGGTAKVICPELIMRAFNQGVDALPITTLNQSWTSPRCSANAGPRQCPER